MLRKTPVFYLVVLILCLLLHSRGSFSPANQILGDWISNLRFSKITSKDDVVVIGIDEQTISGISEPLALWHETYAEAFEIIAMSDAKAIGLDIVWPNKSFSFLVKDADKVLVKSLKNLSENMPVVIGQALRNDGKSAEIFPPITIAVGQNNIGLIALENDSDGIIRRWHLKTPTGVPTFAPLIAQALKKPNYDKGYINYSIGGPIPYIPLEQLLLLKKANNLAQLKSLLEDRVIIFGTVLPYQDRLKVPVPLLANASDRRNVPGALVHAQIVRTIINDKELAHVPVLVDLLFVFGASCVWFLGSLTISTLIVLTGLLVFLVAATWYAVEIGLVFSLGSILSLAILSFLSRLSFNGVLSVLERNRLRGLFGRYVSKSVLEGIVDGSINHSTQGKKEEVCVLFSDIRDFTTRSESLSAEQTIALLNRYFNKMVTVIHRNGGTVDKFIGDGLMAFFGAPNSVPNTSSASLRAAQEMKSALKELNDALEESAEPIDIAIGIHRGECVVGHVGADDRSEYTVIGDVVNVASRLEGVAKNSGSAIVVSDDLLNDVEFEVASEDLGEVSLKGHSPVHAHAVKGEID